MNAMTGLFREWWVRGQQHNYERGSMLRELGLEYHFDLGLQLAYVESGMYPIVQVYREVFGLDGNDYALEQEKDWLEHLAQVNGTTVSTERHKGLRQAIERYTCFPSDMCAPPDSWVRGLRDAARYEYPESLVDYYRRQWRGRAELERHARELDLRALEKKVNPILVLTRAPLPPASERALCRKVSWWRRALWRIGLTREL